MRGRREEIKGRIDEEWEYTRPPADRRKVDWCEKKKKNGREHQELLVHFSSGDQKGTKEFIL